MMNGFQRRNGIGKNIRDIAEVEVAINAVSPPV
jgi:hypothetical protein